MKPASSKPDWRAYEDIGVSAAPPTVARNKLDRIHSGMTLGELTDLLGRGWMRCQVEGCGIIKWTCKDGRQLHVWPTTYRREEVIAAGPRGDSGKGGRGRMWLIRLRDRRESEDVPIPQK